MLRLLFLGPLVCGALLAASPLHPVGAAHEDAHLPEAQLPDLVAEATGYAGPFERPPALVRLPILGRLVLAWEVQLPLREGSRRRLWLSAVTGELIHSRELALGSRARVFRLNPAVTPAARDVQLTGIDATQAGVALSGTRVTVLNCLDSPGATTPAWREEGQCYPQPRALSDAAGDFFVSVPNVVFPEDNRQSGDAFAEVSAYYHAEKFLTALAAMGVPGYRCDHVTIVTNLHDLGDPFGPVNRGTYTDQCDASLGPTLTLGQGTDVDFAYDGDVIYHELGHGVVAMLTPDNLADPAYRSDGVVFDAAALQESFADYFAFVIADDPNVGEYVARFWIGFSGAALRSGETNKVCPDDLAQNADADAEIFDGALWSARLRIGPAFDDVVLGALPRLAVDATFEDAAAALLAVADELLARGDLSSGDIELLRRALSSRGLIDCPRVIREFEEVSSGVRFPLIAKPETASPFRPAPIQIAFELPPEASEAVVSYQVDGDATPETLLLLKFSPEAIAYAYEVDEAGAITVSGDWDLEIPFQPFSPDEHLVRLPGLEPGDALHAAVANLGDADLTIRSFLITAEAPDFGGTSTSSGTTGAPAQDDAAGDARPNFATCACRNPGRSFGFVAWLLPALATRRRRGRTPLVR